MSSIGQSPIYQDKNTLISAGLELLAFGVSVNFLKKTGDLTYNAGIGFGFMNEFSTNCGVNFSSGVTGSYILTNDPKNESKMDDPYIVPRFTGLKGLNLVGKKNKHNLGSWVKGAVYSSPLWIDMIVGNNISRISFGFPLKQDRTQNWLHRNLVYQNFYNKYSNSITSGYGYFGYYNPFTFYTR